MSDKAITTVSDMGEIERVLVGGDLSQLSPAQRVTYYQGVCKSMGLNHLTRPFDYITLNGKLTLYAKKDAADQLRKINGVSVDDIDISETADSFIVKVKGHDKTGRSDVEIGVVKKSDMRGDAANAQMKAVTKAKRRLTLSLCGLGWLDETEIETIPDARPVAPEAAEAAVTKPNGIGARYTELAAEAAELGITAEPVSSFTSTDEIRKAGRELRQAVDAAKAKRNQ